MKNKTQSNIINKKTNLLKKKSNKNNISKLWIYKQTPKGPKGYYTLLKVKVNPKTLYIFGENNKLKGTGIAQFMTQAVIRPAKNAAPIRTCYGPGDCMTDTTLTQNKKWIKEDINDIIKLLSTPKYNTVVYPGDGIGTGVANLHKNAPKTWKFLQNELKRLNPKLKN